MAAAAAAAAAGPFVFGHRNHQFGSVGRGSTYMLHGPPSKVANVHTFKHFPLTSNLRLIMVTEDSFPSKSGFVVRIPRIVYVIRLRRNFIICDVRTAGDVGVRSIIRSETRATCNTAARRRVDAMYIFALERKAWAAPPLGARRADRLSRSLFSPPLLKQCIGRRCPSVCPSLSQCRGEGEGLK